MTILSLYTCSSSLILLFLSCTNLFLRTNAAPLVNICAQTKEASLCLSVLGSDPRSQSAALPQLAQIAIDTAETKAITTKYKIHALLMSTENPNLEKLYIQCENSYLDLLAALRIAPDDLQRRQYGDLNVQGVNVRAGVNRCEAAFNQNSPFNKENGVIGILGDAIAVIANVLSR